MTLEFTLYKFAQISHIHYLNCNQNIFVELHNIDIIVANPIGGSVGLSNLTFTISYKTTSDPRIKSHSKPLISF